MVTVPTTNEDGLRSQVREAYSSAAACPAGEHPFPVGLVFARSVGYPDDLLRELPAEAVAAFCGTSNVSIFAEFPVGATVLDLGCGAALDTLVAAKRVGQDGGVVAADFSEPMLARGRAAASSTNAENVEFLRTDAEKLPIASEMVDVALVNGLFNLNPARDAIFRELARVVRPDGVVYAAEIVLREAPGPLKRIVRRAAMRKDDPNNWFA